MSGSRVVVTGAGVTGTLHVDDVDISNAARGVTVTVGYGGPPRVEVDLIAETAVHLDDAEVVMKQVVYDLLVLSGWTPPASGPRIDLPTEDGLTRVESENEATSEAQARLLVNHELVKQIEYALDHPESRVRRSGRRAHPHDGSDRVSRTHIAGQLVTIDGRHMRQLCAWCGWSLIDYDLTRVAVPEGTDPTPATWTVGALVTVDGNAAWIVQGDRLPDDACARETDLLRPATGTYDWMTPAEGEATAP